VLKFRYVRSNMSSVPENVSRIGRMRRQCFLNDMLQGTL
jgi:hypothetical protein